MRGADFQWWKDYKLPRGAVVIVEVMREHTGLAEQVGIDRRNWFVEPVSCDSKR